MRFALTRSRTRAAACVLAAGVAAVAALMVAPGCAADPASPSSGDNEPPVPVIFPDPNDYSIPYRPDIVPLPQVVASQTNWEPKYPFPFDEMRNQVTEADIRAEAEMCQWFTAQFDTLTTQIDTLTFLLAPARGNYGVGEIAEKANIVTANIFQSVDFLAPRAQALTQRTDFAGDVYFPIYQGKNFFNLWQQLHNVGIGIQSRHASWDFGPPRSLMENYASGIRRSHVCD